MGELLKEALQVLLQPLVILLHPRGPLSVYYWAGALVFLAIFFFAWCGRRYRRRGLRGFLAYAFPKHIFGHPSAKVDYRFFLANALVGPLIFSVAIAASEFWRGLTLEGLHALFGAGASAPATVWPVVALTTVVIFLALEFGYWFAHILLHHVPVLWEIHKVHHSAEVMTPATAARVHPLEDVLISNIIAVTVGIAYGLLVHTFGAGAQEFALWQVNVLFLVFYFTTYHLRHSHVWMTVPGPLARLIHSPAHHQIHHSTDPRHMNKKSRLLPVAVGLGLRHPVGTGQGREGPLRHRRREPRIQQRVAAVLAAAGEYRADGVAADAATPHPAAARPPSPRRRGCLGFVVGSLTLSLGRGRGPFGGSYDPAASRTSPISFHTFWSTILPSRSSKRSMKRMPSKRLPSSQTPWSVPKQ